MGESGPYSRTDIRRAVNWAAFLGWAVIVAPIVPTNPGWLPWAAAIGLPIAFGACWLIGAPVLRRMLRRPMSYGLAAFSGGLIAALMSLASIAIGRFFGWMESMDDSRRSQWGGGKYIQSVDGILTPYGWQVVAQDSLTFIGMGAAIAIIIRAGIGPGKAPGP